MEKDLITNPLLIHMIGRCIQSGAAPTAAQMRDDEFTLCEEHDSKLTAYPVRKMR
jgi:hypothetical protein